MVAWADTDAHIKRLKPEWTSTCQTLGISEDCMECWWDKLVARHCEPQRAYHTLAHLSEMFDYMGHFRDKITDVAAVSLAIFFHDSIYWPRAGSPKNEQDSMELFDVFGQEALPDGKPLGLQKGEFIAKIKKWIWYTAEHKCPWEEMDCKLFMDFDMAVLGKPIDEYLTYSKQIRREYSHVPEAAFCKARGAFLLSSADGDWIYATDEFRGMFEKQARDNMKQEAALLSEQHSRINLVLRLVGTAALRFNKSWGKAKEIVFKQKMPIGVVAMAALAYVAPRVARAIAVAAPGLAGLFWLRWKFGARYVRYPYPEPRSHSGAVLLAGSYNPPHLGHLEMLKYLSKAHDKVVAVIGVNPTKKYDVSPYQRQAILRAMIKDAGLTNVDAIVYSSIIFVYAHSIGASVMYRGIRTWEEDGEAEKNLEYQNLLYQPYKGYWPIPTAYLQGSPALVHVSSTLLRNRIKEGASFDDLVPASCAEEVRIAYAPKDGN